MNEEIGNTKQTESRRIVHVDMDAFFAAIEELDFPALRNKPVIVGADPKQGSGRGVVSTCNYIARSFGVHSAMPVSKAWKLCPTGIFQPSRMKRYSQISKQIMQIFEGFSPIVEIVGIDEAYLDCTGTHRIYKTDLELAHAIQNQIKIETGLNASVGIAPNKYIAKIASDLNKPFGVSICKPGQEKCFLSSLPVKRLWGAGKVTIEKLNQAGIHNISDITSSTSKKLESILGNRSSTIQKLANGIDNREVKIGWLRKSISEEITFQKDTSNTEYLENCLANIADQLGQKIRREKSQFRCIQLKLRYSNFETYTRNKTLNEYTDISKIIRDIAIDLFRNLNSKQHHVRLIGIGLSHLLHNHQKDYQLPLFSQEMLVPELAVQKKRDSLIDEINTKFHSKLTSGRNI